MEKFRKGQMVPKRLKMAITHRKVQHNITFGCDVEIDGRTVRAINSGDGPIIEVPAYLKRTRNNGTRQKHRIVFKDISFENCTTAISLSNEWYILSLGAECPTHSTR